MSTTRTYVSDILIKEWDGNTRTYSEWDTSGNFLGSRPFTDAENAKADAEEQLELEGANRETLKSRADSALANNRTFIDTPLSELTQAEVVAQVKALSRQNNGLIRVAFRKLTDISDTD